MENASQEEKNNLAAQMKYLYRRLETLRLSIIFASVSVFVTSLIIICLFAICTLNFRLHYWVLALFVLSLLFLVASLVLFIKDLHLSMKALNLELGGRP